MIQIEIIPCLSDNYAYLVINDETHEAVLIDIPEANPINARINALDVDLKAVLITHHHADHVEGLNGLNLDGVKIYGAKHDRPRLPALDKALEVGDRFELIGANFEVLGADGHTMGHIAYHMPEEKALFTADSLMLWGCGRLFEGSPEVMWQTLEGFMSLSDETLIYSGHNYAKGNGAFALSLGGFIDVMQERMVKVEKQNADGVPVVPASLAEEKASNPFLLAVNDDYARELGIDNKTIVDRFAHIRKLKDKF